MGTCFKGKNKAKQKERAGRKLAVRLRTCRQLQVEESQHLRCRAELVTLTSPTDSDSCDRMATSAFLRFLWQRERNQLWQATRRLIHPSKHTRANIWLKHHSSRCNKKEVPGPEPTVVVANQETCARSRFRHCISPNSAVLSNRLGVCCGVEPWRC